MSLLDLGCRGGVGCGGLRIRGMFTTHEIFGNFY